ncbi:hypothetical protein FSY75_09480 [Streptomyces sp. TR1341]|uniref:hypothetical protein n=1 Tax=Streptomyces sp. TR1341 TaxID=2601266 RepID=UPI00138AD12F|nr:hypothetical protein [Streptomyces sp. TR1341]
MTGPDSRPDMPLARGGIIRTGLHVGETPDCGPLPTSPDTARTRQDSGPADNPDGVRFAYTARVPRRHLGAAIAEALSLLARETSPDTARTAPDTDVPDVSGRRAEVRASIADAFDLPPSILRKDPTA